MEFTTHLELHSQTTRLFEGTLQRTALLATRDSHPLWRPVPRNIDKERPQSCPLQITTRAPKVPDFKFELLPLHSPLLRQSRLVSFPPLIDMLKFSGYSYLIWGQTLRVLIKPYASRRQTPASLYNTYKLIDLSLPRIGANLRRRCARVESIDLTRSPAHAEGNG